MRALLLAAAVSSLGASAWAEVGRAGEAVLADLAGRVPLGDRFRIDGLRLGGAGPEVSLELRRFALFTPDAVVVVHGREGEQRLAPPRSAFFRGEVEGQEGARAFVVFFEDGAAWGVVETPAVSWVLSGPAGGPLRAQSLDLGAGPPFRCALDEAPPPPEAAAPAPEMPFPPVTHTARVAVETDYEYFARFGNATAALNYLSGLLGYSSTIYEDQVATELVIPYVSLWSTDADPWAATTSSAALTEFRAYWNANRTGVVRTIAHQLSSRPTGGGVAYVGVLCSTANAYGFTGNISGSFNPANPQPGWDIIAVSHEIGHNFSSPHTHDYCNLGGSASPVDSCYAGCLAGAPLDLPGPGSLTGGTAGARNGTLMSYCHLRSGGYNNVALGFGEAHAHGVLAQRVPDQMRAHVLSRAQSFPACLSLDLLFRDAF
jgi:hypothetical protein